MGDYSREKKPRTSGRLIASSDEKDVEQMKQDLNDFFSRNGMRHRVK